MNIAMEQTEEWSGGLLKNKYGDAFIRGCVAASSAPPASRPPCSQPLLRNNVLYISTVPTPK